MLTIDANVFVSAASSSEIQYSASTEFFVRVLQLSERLYSPTLLVPETIAGIYRPTNDILLARRTASGMNQFPGLILVNVNAFLANAAASVVLQCRLRGADALYVAVAQEYETTLITWDQELLMRGPAVVPTMTPADWLVSHPIG